MFARVAIRRGIAAEGDAAGLAGPEMHPPRVDLDALLADVGFFVLDRGDGVDMGAAHDTLSPLEVPRSHPARFAAVVGADEERVQIGGW